MISPIKFTIGVAALAPLLYGSYYLISFGMPAWHSLSKDGGFGDGKTYTESSFGKKYGNYFVGVKENNRDWWNWVYENRWRVDSLENPNNQGTKFKNDGSTKKVSVGYGEENSSLNKVCDEFYKSTDGTKFKEADFWKYCSAIGIVPITINDSGKTYSGSSTIGETNKNSLISVEKIENDLFWEIRTSEFFLEDGSKSGSKATENSVFHAAFKNRNNFRENLKNICARSYIKESSLTADANDAKSFCAL